MGVANMSSSRQSGRAMSVKDTTFALLRAFGIRKVFGNPGSTELSFLSDWPDDIETSRRPSSPPASRRARSCRCSPFSTPSAHRNFRVLT